MKYPTAHMVSSIGVTTSHFSENQRKREILGSGFLLHICVNKTVSKIYHEILLDIGLVMKMMMTLIL